jgi:hypothetical protein
MEQLTGKRSAMCGMVSKGGSRQTNITMSW